MKSLPLLSRRFWGGCWTALFLVLTASALGDPITLHGRARVRSRSDTNAFDVVEKNLQWEPSRTAIVICDMWDKHHCPDATERVGELVPRMNEVIKAARARGMLILHCPSDTMDFYKDHPGRKLAQSAPKVATRIPLQGWCSLNGGTEPALPIDDSDGGCDGCPDCPSYKAWTRQHPGLEIQDGDAITDSTEAYYLMRQRGITNVIVMGVHINMCVLGRPFSIRQMVTQGQNVVLMRDLTDSMYNHRKSPWVSHFRGTELVTEHIEQYWCPSITSVDLLGGEPFRFKADHPKHIVFVIGENEYHTWETLPEFARKELAWRGYKISYVTASTREGDGDFKNWEIIPQADLLVISVRRRAPPAGMMAAIRAHIAAGKPVAGIRTAIHAFELRGQTAPAEQTWPNFDEEIIGADYQDHYGTGPGKATVVRQIAETAAHPILTGLKSEFASKSHLYRSRKLKNTVTPLLNGRTEDGTSEVEPVAWVNTADNRRVFYTSLGSPDDFRDPDFRRLLLNGVLWSVGDMIPPAVPKKVDHAADWHPMKVPGTWDENSGGALSQYDGFAWYRCWVQVPADWAGRTAELVVESVDDAHAAYVNGQKVGMAGAFPPNFASGLDQPKAYNLGNTAFRPSLWNLIAIQVFDNGGRGGFKGVAPYLRVGNQAIALSGDWQFRTGNELAWAKPGTETPPVAGRFTTVIAADTLARGPKKSEEGQLGPMTPAESAKKFHVAEDLVFEQVLSEPIVAQPVFLTFDARGRMWVVQYRQYPHPAGLKMVSRDNFWRAVYDKVPPPPPNHFKGADRITIHEDTHGNGVFDKHTTFVDGLNIATSVAFGADGVYVLNPPYLLFYPDRNHDDVPDGDPQVLLSGFGLEDTHSVANSLRWGPDGWLYGCQGSTVTGNILVYGADGKPIQPKPMFSQGQNIWRYHPQRRVYEIFSEGGGNAFGLELDSAGRIFSGHNGGNTRGFHYQQGAYLQKGFDKHGPLSNPYAFGYFPQMPHPDVDRFTHNFLIYDSEALGEVYQGRLLGVEPLQGRIVMSEITAEGSSFRTRDLGYPVTSDDKWFRPVDIKLGPDGAIYVCDWYDRQVNHYRNHEGQMDASNGRIYRLRPRSAKPVQALDLSAARSDALVNQLKNSNRFIRQQSLQLLAERQDSSVVPALQQMLSGPETSNTPLEAFWALYRLGQWSDAAAEKALSHPHPQIRAWAVRLLGDERRVSAPISRRLTDLASTEPNIEVRSQLAASARRLPAREGLDLVRALLARDADTGDARQPLMLWWAIEEKCATDREAVLALFSDRELWRAPMVQSHILSRLMRRFAATGRREDLLTCARLFALSPGPTETARLTQGFEEAFKGRPLVGLPEELLTAMERAGGESVMIGARRGRPAAVEKALELVRSASTDMTQRLQLIQVFGETRQPSAVPVLLAVVRDAREVELRRAALGALQLYASPEIASEILTQFPTFPVPLQPAALGLLTSRPTLALDLLRAVDSGRLPKSLVPADSVRKIKSMPGDELAQLTAKLWPNIRQATSAELEHEIGRLSEVISLTTGSPYTGKKLFMAQCGVCHKLFGKGAEIGPDLTTYQRSDLGSLLLNVINPNAEIREGYESFSVETRDGRNLTGFLADKDTQIIVLRTPDGQTVPLPRSEILKLEPAGSSLMPEGLLGGLKDQEVRDLFAYLRSTQPLNDGN